MSKRNILIIGASRGIGFGITEKLLEDGDNVYTLCRTKFDNLTLTQKDKIIKHYEFDVTTEFTLTDLPETLDALIYCPGNINLKPFPRLKVQDFYDDLNLNLFGAIKILNQTINLLKKGNNPSVLMFSSVAVKLGMSYHSSTSSSKSAVEGFIKSLASEYAPTIRFNAIAPTLTDTPLASQLLSNEEKRKQLADRNPLKRIGKVEDIVEMSLFLTSDKASYISGQIIAVDGGMNTLK